VPVDTSAAVAALTQLAVLIDAATKDGVADGADLVQGLGRTYAPHLSGELASSITITGPAATGPAEYTAKVGPTMVYGRIREIGGAIPGRKGMTHPFLRWSYGGHWVFKHKVHQHGAKYMLHAVEDVRPQFRSIVARRWANAIDSV